jgi:hypothetical protein
MSNRVVVLTARLMADEIESDPMYPAEVLAGLLDRVSPVQPHNSRGTLQRSTTSEVTESAAEPLSRLAKVALARNVVAVKDPFYGVAGCRNKDIPSPGWLSNGSAGCPFT